MQKSSFFFSTSDGSKVEVVLPESESSSLDESSSNILGESFSTSGGSTYSGSRYYTPDNMGEGFYTPWGTESFDIGVSYYKILFGTVGVIAILIFVMPYAIDFVRNIVDEFRDGMR